MEKVVIRMIVPEAVQLGVSDIPLEDGSKISEPHPFTARTENLNSPVGAAEIQAAAALCTAIFASGSAALLFFEKLKDLIRDGENVVTITDKSGERTITITGKSSDKEIKEFLAKK